jgi:hypothetical protein
MSERLGNYCMVPAENVRVEAVTHFVGLTLANFVQLAQAADTEVDWTTLEMDCLPHDPTSGWSSEFVQFRLMVVTK